MDFVRFGLIQNKRTRQKIKKKKTGIRTRRRLARVRDSVGWRQPKENRFFFFL